jgi:hypothetical protein
LWQFGVFCGNLVYFMAIWCILWLLGVICGHLVYIFYGTAEYFRPFWYAVPNKSGNTDLSFGGPIISDSVPEVHTYIAPTTQRLDFDASQSTIFSNCCLFIRNTYLICQGENRTYDLSETRYPARTRFQTGCGGGGHTYFALDIYELN